MNTLALAGSLRHSSINAAFLRVSARRAPNDIVVSVFAGMDNLPLFNPDLDTASPETVPAAVQDLRAQVAAADAILIASPEYAHGISGVMKNALDWLVSFEPFAGKPVAVINTSPRARHADAALREVLATMAARLVGPASVSIALLGSALDEAAMMEDAALGDQLTALYASLRAITTP